MTVRQVGQVDAPLKQKVDQFQLVIDNNDQIVERIKEKINRVTPQREKLAACVQQRQDDRRSLVCSLARLEDASASLGVESAQLEAIIEELPRILERISLPAGQQGMVTSMPGGIGPSSSSVSFAAVARPPTTMIDVSDDKSQSTWWHSFLDPEDLLTMRAASRICHDIAMQHMQSAGTAGNDKAVSFETWASSTSAPMPTLPTPPTTSMLSFFGQPSDSKKEALASRLATHDEWTPLPVPSPVQSPLADDHAATSVAKCCVRHSELVTLRAEVECNSCDAAVCKVHHCQYCRLFTCLQCLAAASRKRATSTMTSATSTTTKSSMARQRC